MIHQKQRAEECALAVLAMLAGVSLNDVRDVALRSAEEICKRRFSTWSDVLHEGKYCEVYEALCKVFGVPLTREQVWPPNVPNTTGSNPDLTGRGTIRISWPRCRHIVAYENGIVFDSGLSKPMPFEEWWAKLHPKAGLKIERVDPMGETERS